MTLVAFWFVVLTVVWTGFLLLEGFDFGVGMLHGVVGRDEAGRDLAIRTIGPVWDGNEVWLIVATAVTFAAFPVWYATMFSAYYPIMVVVLVALILRGVSFEFRSHSESPRARALWSGALAGGSLVVPLGLGIVLGGLLAGVPIDSAQEFVGGAGDLFPAYALMTGATVVLVCLVHGAVFLALKTTAALRRRALGIAQSLAPVVAVVVTGWAAWTRVTAGDGVLLSVAEFGAILAAITAAAFVHVRREGLAFAATATTMAALTTSIFSELYPRVMVSSLGAANDLTTTNTASASYALTVMTVVLAVLLPVVLVYQAWTYHVFRARLGGGRAPEPPGSALAGAGGGAAAARDPSGPAPGTTGTALVRAVRPLDWPRLRVLVVLLGWAILRHAVRPELLPPRRSR
ncbi:cytochrome d ubiquinol oxidase subunit II [Pseudonocardia sp. RS010]|uniref:cytochrome d ubiquinol oxidase subunit II n=1 Tax=Pseudonocardia sp. RS010 TaxID=3385979 RepID=UPI0039A02CE5